ncbi:MAG: ATP-dependent DNA helicase [Clostridium sp.]|jgi:Rad3-related DNA helicase|uniref:ATP-dependent DNA helicase n=1 Tax=Clostridium sp. TaxID=1506 RepID=UPI0025BD427A|nr:ATP-dependent DNA helicase [Clostridium sp.]MCH3963070.1 ATP-dependent DNA helicase [Clostridium sp.]MCI1716467.1 ATP-dependent DNA helicase [Clostridium sp.]MCI1800807.1 ATP-dependent DNA helicase [Clostridium sp.]MCI1814538.1 ATP-dependent DNA helicase [Clostridium sp.]MCI1871448.1 ATP-dependent DNA helicase [Clostridium sp.]
MACNENEIKISVRNLVEFVFRYGDLDNRFTSSARAVEGTRVHQELQKQYKSRMKEKDGIQQYDSEVLLKYKIQYRSFKFFIEGRADGVIVQDDCTIIDEIKTVAIPLDTIDENYNPLHFAQAKCYGYIYSIQNNLEDIYIQLTYYNIDDNKVKFIKKEFRIGELKGFFEDVLERYYKWAEFKNKWNEMKNSSIEKLKFPFGGYRKGQRDLAVAVYGTIRDGRRLFAKAPTGTGKTISVLFPSIKAMGQEIVSRIFYLTAKTITRTAAENTIRILTENGLKLKTLTLTAKEKMCFKDEVTCNPEKCEFAKGHYDRVNEAIFDIINRADLITRDKIIEYSRNFKVCPFEFSLDLALFCDCIICDYNYAFDPEVYLRRFFDDSASNYILLIDEAHNLVDRSREMFSAEIHKKPFLDIKKFIKGDIKSLKALNKINSYMLKLKKGFEDIYVQKDKLVELYFMLKDFLQRIEKWIVQHPESEGYEQILELYFAVNSFIKIGESYNSSFVTYMENMPTDIKIKVLCLDSASLLDERMEGARAAILFSATLSPIGYFKEMLGGRDGDYNITIPSPFDIQNRTILIANNVSTVYRKRGKSYLPIVRYINEMISMKVGNYMVFFPSYCYMEKVYELFTDEYPDVGTVIQKSGMDEDERDEFLMNFTEKNGESFVAFAVLGGIFSEGIDLKKDRLIGTIIVGVGVPGICFERNIIMKYFNRKNGLGYEYAYMYPGMNKVLQAAGRVIRTEEDRGVIFLIDNRFLTREYKSLFPKEWYPNNIVNSTGCVKSVLSGFWNSV